MSTKAPLVLSQETSVKIPKWQEAPGAHTDQCKMISVFPGEQTWGWGYTQEVHRHAGELRTAPGDGKEEAGVGRGTGWLPYTADLCWVGQAVTGWGLSPALGTAASSLGCPH